MKQNTQKISIIRGTFLLPENGSMTLIRDGLLEVDEKGTISKWSKEASSTDIPITAPGCVWMPGFVDTHVHFPQTRVIARSSGALLPWLEQTVFPEESRFKEPSYAREVAQEFCAHLIQQGTTCASIYGSSHISAAQILFESLDSAGLRAQAGPTLMDQGAPTDLCLPAADAIPGCRELIQKWHGHDRNRLRFVVTPRFALSCSKELLREAGELAREFELPIQTHLSENVDEIEAVKRAFPESENYLSVYDRFGLCTKHSLFAHCVHLKDPEWNLLQDRGSSISHCPDSNFFLGSGVFPLKTAQEKGIPVGMGSDVGAGRTFNMRRIVASAYDASLLAQKRISPAELLWVATAGGAEALGLQSSIGKISVGWEADLIAIRVRQTNDFDALVDELVFQADQTPVVSTWVRGRKL